MPRRPRPEHAGGVFHITSRGVNKASIYYGDDDLRRFVRLLEQVRDHFEWIGLTYCLMSNHFHLLVQTPKPNLAAGMQQLKGQYAADFNRRHGRTGPLYDGRYYSVVERTDIQLATAFAYIALNPVRAGLCADPGEWRWSGHRALIGRAVPGPVNVNRALNYFGDHPDGGRRGYVEMVEMWQGV